ncbi:MAG: glycosyltransferase family 2 protein [Candidatus Komeilibacteria bacterium]|mgnify:CR=1 FL=1|jgi:dolichyl-phosphate beta-glucosyltransferase|nr:glycosyltransferase family 2 protein [Candidatus Komeilibacteria bacterium]MBT4448063.1 glycosyltransferase family 2 protein [Candidatus Komeilibacteria bacterium]
MEISVVIPAFNEAKVIKDTVVDIKDFLKNNFSNFEIIVIDDKSRDRTLEIIKSIEGIKVIANLKNHGKGYSIKKGMKNAKGDLLLFMDADNSTNISELKNFLPQIKDNHIVIASRGLEESKVQLSQSVIKKYLGILGNIISRILIDRNIKDTQCGFKLFRRDVKVIFDKLTIDRFAFDFELIFLAKKYKFKVKEMPITWVNNFDSEVKWYDYPKTMLILVLINIKSLLGKYN